MAIDANSGDTSRRAHVRREVYIVLSSYGIEKVTGDQDEALSFISDLHKLAAYKSDDKLTIEKYNVRFDK